MQGIQAAATLFLLGTAPVVAGHAQDADPAPGAQKPPSVDASPKPDYADIVVSALRRDTQLLRTPAAVTVLSGEQLAARGITNPVQLSQEVPNLIVNRANAGVIQATIRGVSSQDVTEKGDSSVGFLIDGIYIARPQAVDSGLFDLERTEVLRGPQGTLFGRNTTGGIINFIPRRPTDDLEAGVSITAGNYRSLLVDGHVNVPLGDRLALRIAGQLDIRDSYLREGVNQPLVPVPPADTGSALPRYNDSRALRATARYQAADGLQLLLTFDYADLNGGRYDFVSQRALFDFPAQPSPPFPSGSVDATRPTPVDRGSAARRTVPFEMPFELSRNDQSWGVRGEADWALSDAVRLTYLGSFRRFRTRGQTVFGLFDVPVGGQPDDRYDQNSQELRIAYDLPSRLELQAGLFYFAERSRVDSPVQFGALSPFLGQIFGVTAPTDNLTRTLFRQSRADSWAVFAQGTYTIADAIRLTLGARYTEDIKARDGFDEVRAGASFDPATDVRLLDKGRVNFGRATWRAGVDMDLAPDTMGFLTISTGYKSGGFNDGCTAGAVGRGGLACANPTDPDRFFYRPETVTSFEGGVKSFVPALQLGVQLTAFHYRYSNLQLLRNSADLSGTVLFENAATARNTGVEAEGSWRVDRHTSVIGSATYLHTRLGDYQPLGPSGPNFRGMPLERAPEWTAALRIRHQRPLFGGQITLGAGTRFSGSYMLYDYTYAVTFRQPSFFKSDASIDYSFADSRLSVGAFVNNIEDYVEATSIQPGNVLPGTGLVPGYAAVGQPRTWGIRTILQF